MMKRLAMLLATAAALLPTQALAQGVPLRFTISGDYTASFRLTASPVPDFVADGYLFAVTGVPGLPGTTGGLADLSFFNGGVGGGLLISESGGFDYLFDAAGDQLYTGPESAPTFRQGPFTLTGLSTPGTFVLTISAIPEPAIWSIAITGFAMLGGAMRVRRRRTTVRFAR